MSALERSPHLLHRESCMERFLQRDDNVVEEAVQRFVGYWNLRFRVYEDQSFEPLIQSTLSQSCRAILRAGWVASLPPDSWDRPVCFIQAIDEYDGHVPQKELLQCIFYVLQRISEDASAQTTGIAIILGHPGCPGRSPLKTIKALEDILQVMPIKVACVHIVCKKNQPENLPPFYEDYLPVVLKILIDSGTEGDQDEIAEKRLHTHFGLPTAKLLQALKQAGFRQETLPQEIGGSWTEKHQETIIEKLAALEYCRATLTQTLPAFSFPGALETIDSTGNVADRRKKRDAWHSRTKRTRKNCRTRALELYISHLTEQQHDLSETNLRLERALEDAKGIVATVEANRERVPEMVAPTRALYAQKPSPPHPSLLSERQRSLNRDSSIFLSSLHARKRSLSSSLHSEPRAPSIDATSLLTRDPTAMGLPIESRPSVRQRTETLAASRRQDLPGAEYFVGNSFHTQLRAPTVTPRRSIYAEVSSEWMHMSVQRVHQDPSPRLAAIDPAYGLSVPSAFPQSSFLPQERSPHLSRYSSNYPTDVRRISAPRDYIDSLSPEELMYMAMHAHEKRYARQAAAIARALQPSAYPRVATRYPADLSSALPQDPVINRPSIFRYS